MARTIYMQAMQQMSGLSGKVADGIAAYLFSKEAFLIMMSVFTLTLWVEGTVGAYSELARAWAKDASEAFELPRKVRIIRGFLMRRRLIAGKRKSRTQTSCRTVIPMPSERTAPRCCRDRESTHGSP